MIRIAIALCALALAFPSAAKQSGKAMLGSVPPASSGSGRGATATSGGGARLLQGQRLRKAPELDPQRKVNVQDCTKPVDLLAGNLRCK